MISLLETRILSFVRDDPNSKGYYDENRRYVEASKLPPIQVEGNMQPFKAGNNLLRDGEHRLITEQGYNADDARIFYSATKLNPLDPFAKTKADRTTIDGHSYFVFSAKDWSGYGLSAEHYEYILVREDHKSD